MISSLWARRQSCAALSLILLGVAAAGTTSAQSPLLYVPNRTSSTVQVFSINSSSGALGALASQPAANQASVIAVAPNNKFMYVGANPVIYPFVVASNGSLTAVAGTPPTVGGVSGLAIDPTGKFLFASAGDTIFTLSIDQTTGALTVGTSVSLGGGTAPHGLTVDGGGHLYAAMTGSGAVGQFSINSSTGALTPIGTGFAASDGGTERVAVSGSSLFATNLSGNTVTAFTIGGTGALTINATTPFVTVPGLPTGLTVDGNFLIVTAQGANTATVFSIGGGGVLAQVGAPVATGTAPIGVTADPSGAFIYIANSAAGSIGQFGFNTTTGALTPVTTLATGGAPNFLLARGAPAGTGPIGPTSVPTLSSWGLALLGTLLVGMSALMYRRAYR
jgi:6-phosphogluconolactonase (cycloisomerase 2 family)